MNKLMKRIIVILIVIAVIAICYIGYNLIVYLNYDRSQIVDKNSQYFITKGLIEITPEGDSL